jgi:hypothetical protein
LCKFSRSVNHRFLKSPAIPLATKSLKALSISQPRPAVMGGLKFSPQALRSLRERRALLAFRHAGETAMQLGHGESPELLHRHYKGMATETEAVEFWKIAPAAAPENILEMKTAAPSGKAKAKAQARKKA